MSERPLVRASTLRSSVETFRKLGLFMKPEGVHKRWPMPLQFYTPLAAPCRLCGTGFEHRQPAGSADLKHCPKCGQKVIRAAVHPTNSPKLSAPLSVSRARQAGFTVFKRTSGGEYERQ